MGPLGGLCEEGLVGKESPKLLPSESAPFPVAYPPEVLPAFRRGGSFFSAFARFLWFLDQVTRALFPVMSCTFSFLQDVTDMLQNRPTHSQIPQSILSLNSCTLAPAISSGQLLVPAGWEVSFIIENNVPQIPALWK